MTLDTTSQAQELDALDACLAVHGPDLDRWPNDSRQRFEGLLEGSAAAQNMLREARALEQLTRAVTEPSADRLQRLRDGVMQAAAQDTAHVQASPASRPRLAAVSPVAATQDAAAVPTGTLQNRKAPPTVFSFSSYLALAASLLLGIVIGAAGLPQAAFELPSTGTMVSEAESDDAELAFGTGVSDLDAEDFL